MTTQPSFMTDLRSVNSNTAVVSQSTQSAAAGQHAPQNLSTSQSSEVQTIKNTSTQSSNTSQTEVTSQVSQDAPLSLAKVLVPAQVAVVAHSFSDQAQQQSVLFQALTAQSAPHFIALTVPAQEGERSEITVQSTQGAPCIQYIDEGGGTNVFSSPNSQMTTFSIYTSPETTNMYSQNSTAYYTTNSTPENYSQVNISEGQGQDSGVHTFTEEQNVFHVLDDSNIADSENSHIIGYPSSRLSTATMSWLLDNYEMADGMSVPRSSMYSHYLKHCSDQKMEPLNAASFGKLIRAVFTGLRTRRLGTRGNSKYHYYGIRLKATSTAKSLGDLVNTSYRNSPYMQIRRLKTEQSLKNGSDGSSDKKYIDSAEEDKKSSPQSQTKSHQIILGDTSTAIPNIDIEVSTSSLPQGITLEKINLFKTAYRSHCEAILESVVNFQFADVETLWQTFWNASSENQSDSHLNKSLLLALLSYDPVKEFIKQTDYQFYQNLVDVLIPDVLRPIPSTLTQAIRNFAKSLEGWLKAAVSHCGSDILNIKLSAISAFAQTLRRYTSLNHLAQAARAVLQSPTQIKQMTSDLNKVDFRNIQDQASWVCQCEDFSVRQLLSEFRQTLQHHLWLEEWATWLENIVSKTLEPYEGKPAYPKAARQFLLKWSFYSSLVIRDLTLRSAASFGSFHLLRLLYDEYMFFVVEHCIAKATGTTSIAVMGEYLCSGEPEGLADLSEVSKDEKELYYDSESKEMEHNGCVEEELKSSQTNESILP